MASMIMAFTMTNAMTSMININTANIAIFIFGSFILLHHLKIIY